MRGLVMRRFVAIQISLMVFLAAMSLAGALALGEAMGRWSASASSTLTIQVPAGDSKAAGALAVVEISKVLSTIPEIVSIHALSDQELNILLEPWLGSSGNASDLPIPHLITVKVADGAAVDPDKLSQRLSRIAPEVTVDSHRRWLAGLLDATWRLRVTAWSVVGLLVLATAATIVHAVSAALAADREEIEVMFLLGAEDPYVVKLYARAAQRQGLIGGVIGVLFALLALRLVVSGTNLHALSSLEGMAAFQPIGIPSILPLVTLPAMAWLLPLALPVITAAIARFVAAFAVNRHLLRQQQA